MRICNAKNIWNVCCGLKILIFKTFGLQIRIDGKFHLSFSYKFLTFLCVCVVISKISCKFAAMIRKKVISFLLVVIFISYYASTILFSHTHIISGATIIHSHIHANSHHNTKSGEHTTCHITLIAQISHFESVVFSFLLLPSPLQFQLNQHNFVETTHWITSIYFQNLSLRAPPVDYIVT